MEPCRRTHALISKAPSGHSRVERLVAISVESTTLFGRSLRNLGCSQEVKFKLPQNQEPRCFNVLTRW